MLKNFSIQKRNELNISFLDYEPLFDFVDSFLDNVDSVLKYKKTSKIENWTDAKALIGDICKSKSPHKMVNTAINGIYHDAKSFTTSCRDETHFHSRILHSLSELAQREEVEAVIISATLISHFLFLLTKEGKYELLTNKMKEFLDWNPMNEMLDQITEAFNNGEIEDSYDYLLNAPKSKDEEQKSVPSDDETTTIVTGKKGQENKRRITARQIGQIVDEYKWETGLKKEDLQSMLHRITGLSEASLKDAIRCKEK